MIHIIYRHILRRLALLPALAMALVLGACSMMTDEEPADPSQTGAKDYSVSIRISAGNQSDTRALPEEFGTNLENTIDLHDLKILVFDENRILKDIWYNDGQTPDNITLSEVGLGDYIISGKLDGADYNLTSRFSIAALVNWKSLMESEPVELKIGTTRYSDLADKALLVNNGNPEQSWVPENDSLIPMYGVLYTTLAGYSTGIYNEGHPMDLGTINVLRALAKIEIIDNGSNEKVQITSIKLTKRNCRGFLTPNIFDYKNTEQVTLANIPGAGGNGTAMDPLTTTSSLRFHKTGNLYVAYVPEMALGGTIESRMLIDVDIYYNNYSETRKIVFAPYNSEGQPVVQPSGWSPEWKALLRNHIYRFTIQSITADPYIVLTVDVQPFSNVTLKPDFGLERTEDGYIVVRDKNGHIVKYIRPDGSELYFKEDNRWPYLGTFMGVFDDQKRVLTGYFEDGRSIIFNYTSDVMNEDDIYENLESWGIYSRPDLTDSKGNLIKVHLEETFYFENYENDGVDGGYVKYMYTHSLLDPKGRVIEEYRYPTLQAFWEHKAHEKGEGSHDNCSRIKLADYTGDRYGDKVITYYDHSGNKTAQLKVTGDTETLTSYK